MFKSDQLIDGLNHTQFNELLTLAVKDNFIFHKIYIQHDRVALGLTLINIFLFFMRKFGLTTIPLNLNHYLRDGTLMIHFLFLGPQ